MTTIFRVIIVFFLYLFIIAGLFTVEAHEFKVGALDIGHPWSRPTPKDATIAGGYLTITNKGKVADRLIGGASPAASQIEVHEMANVDGMTKTRALANGLEIKPGRTIELKPGAYRLPAAEYRDKRASDRSISASRGFVIRSAPRAGPTTRPAGAKIRRTRRHRHQRRLLSGLNVFHRG